MALQSPLPLSLSIPQFTPGYERADPTVSSALHRSTSTLGLKPRANSGGPVVFVFGRAARRLGGHCLPSTLCLRWGGGSVRGSSTAGGVDHAVPSSSAGRRGRTAVISLCADTAPSSRSRHESVSGAAARRDRRGIQQMTPFVPCSAESGCKVLPGQGAVRRV